MTDNQAPSILRYDGEALGFVSKTKKVPFTPLRDVTHCYGVCVRNAVKMAALVLKDDDAGMEHLNIFSAMLADLYKASLAQLPAWMGGFRRILEYMSANPGSEGVFGLLCMCVVMNINAFVFTSANMGINAGETFSDEDAAGNFLAACAAVGGEEGERGLKAFLGSLALSAPGVARGLVPLLKGEWEKYFKRVGEYQREFGQCEGVRDGNDKNDKTDGKELCE